MNRNLESRKYKIDSDILNVLKKQYNKYSKSVNVLGFNTLKNIISKNVISGNHLKQIKHRIENNEKTKILFGDEFYNWINLTLKTVRDSENSTKELKKTLGHNIRKENVSSVKYILINEQILK